MPMRFKDKIEGTITNADYASSAGSASKLGTNAGSATTPVYFSNGVPVALGYTIQTSVPANAKFTDTNTEYSDFTAATSSAAGTHGLVPAPAKGQQNYFLRGDKTWQALSKSSVGLGNVDNTADANKSVKSATTATSATNDSKSQAITSYIRGLSISGKTITYTKGDGTTGTLTTQDTTYSDMKGATSSAAGTHGFVPAPAAGAQAKYLRGDGTWASPPNDNTTYSDFTGATADAAGAHGLVPAPAKGVTTQYLKSTGAWGAVAWGEVSGKPSTFTPASHTHKYASSFSVNGKTVTVTYGDGTTSTFTTQDTNTDTKVTQSAVTASDYTNWRTLIWGASNSGTEGFTPTTVTDQVFSTSVFSCQPSTGTIKATTFKGALSGNASSATKATNDSKDQAITSYIRGLSISGKTITYTKGDGTTGTLTTQDTNTDTKVTNTLGTTTKAYVTGTTTATTNTGSLVFDTGVYLDTTAGMITATTFKGALSGNATTATTATTANKLGTNAGNTTTPVYFADGVPKALSYTIAKSVPSDANFSNTWRGIQDNLTSTSTSDSLSANQGKVLKGLIDAKTTRKTAFVGSDAASSSGWYKFGTQTMSGYGDSNILLAVTSTYGNYFMGILSIQIRSDNTSIQIPALHWLVRKGFAADAVVATISSMTATFYVNQTNGQYGRIGFEVLSESSINGNSSGFTISSNTTKESSTPTASKTSADGATVSYANSAGSATTASKLGTNAGGTTTPVYFSNGVPVALGYTIAKSVPSDAVFTDHTYSNFTGATSSAAGGNGLVPAPASGVTTQYLKSTGAWAAVAWGEISGKPSTFTPASHTHNYAGSSSAGGSATSAVKLDTATAGSATQPVYFTGGKPSACTYTLGKSVPSDAVFTDHTYTTMTAATATTAGAGGLVPAPAAGAQAKFLRGDGTWATPTDTNTDTKVTNTLATTTKAYVTGTTSSSTNTGTQVFDTGVYLDTTAGMLTATTFKGALSGNATSASSAAKLSAADKGSATQPVYFSGGVPVACTYTLAKSVPSNAVFTDTHTLTLADRVSGTVVTCTAIPTT